ncbi:protein tyrosine phosphatase [soil metagenome]
MNEPITSEFNQGRIDVHTHLLPGIDDGCTSVAASLQCARILVQAGYTHAFCTPHIWPSLPGNNVGSISPRVAHLQLHLDKNEIPLRLIPGGETNLHAMWPAIKQLPREQIVTFALAGKHVLFDFWAGDMSDCRDALHQAVNYLRSQDLHPILAHPERIMALQSDPSEIEALRDMGVLLQMNLWCLTEPIHSPVYRTATALLHAGKYFIFGSDCHNPESLPRSMEGLAIAADLVGPEITRKMTIDNPRLLLSDDLPADPVSTDRAHRSKLHDSKR